MADISPHGLPPEEAIKYFKAKGLRLEPTFDWREMWQECHGTGFTVAKSSGFDILSDIYSACQKTLEHGRTLRQIADELMPTLAAKGWWGRKKMVDPVTGAEREVQLGSPRRLRTIYDVNLRTAQAAGAWRHIESTKKRRPWLRYVAIMDSRTRPDHKDWHGTVLRVDDPWWETHYPPNGWRCRCTVQQLSDYDLEDFGFEPSPTAPPSALLPWTNERTGETILTPAGVDPGFGYHIGKAGQSAQAAKVMMDKVGAYPPLLGSEALRAAVPLTPQDTRTSLTRRAVARLVQAGFANWMQNPGRPFPLAVLSSEDATAIGASVQVARISAATFAKQKSHHPELTFEDYALAQEAVADGEKLPQAAKKVAYVLDRPGGLAVIVKATVTGDELYITSLYRLSKNDERLKKALRNLDKK